MSETLRQALRHLCDVIGRDLSNMRTSGAHRVEFHPRVLDPLFAAYDEGQAALNAKPWTRTVPTAPGYYFAAFANGHWEVERIPDGYQDAVEREREAERLGLYDLWSGPIEPPTIPA